MSGEYWDNSYPRLLRKQLDTDQFKADTRWESIKRIHQFVLENVDYQLTGNDIWRPDYVLEHTQEADCQDTSALIATLLDICSIPFRIVTVEHRSDDESAHAFAQALLEEKPETDYDLHVDLQDDGSGYWVSVDPTYQKYPGKRSPYISRYVKPYTYEYFDFRRVEVEKGV